jgi:hypothetical protein
MKTPGSWTVEDLFTGRAQALALFHAVREYIESIGPVTVEATKSQVSFATGTKFAWVWLPRPWDRKRPGNSIVLTFGLRRHIEHERIVQSVEPRPGRWTHHVIIEKEADLDEAVRAWLLEAYSLSQ